MKGLEKNPSYVTGRLLGGQTAGALTLLGTRGRGKLVRAGTSVGTSVGTGLAAGLGDLGYKLVRFGKVLPADILSATLQGEFEGALDDLGSKCQEIIRGY